MARTSACFWSLTLPLAAATCFFFFFNDTATTEIYTLSLHDALPISGDTSRGRPARARGVRPPGRRTRCRTPRARRSEEHTSELQSRSDLVCRLLLEKKKKKQQSDSASPRTHLAQSLCARGRLRVQWA